MPETVINGKDGTADFTIATISHKTRLDMWRMREVTEMTVTDVFSNEGSADQEPGRSQLVGEISGIMTKSAINTGPLIPAPQGVAIVATASTGCFFTLNANFTEAYADRLVNQTGRIGGRFLSKGAYTKTWVTT